MSSLVARRQRIRLQCRRRGFDPIPRLGRSPGGRHGNPCQYFVWRIPGTRGTWRATAHGVTESDMTEATWPARSEGINGKESPQMPKTQFPYCQYFTTFSLLFTFYFYHNSWINTDPSLGTQFHTISRFPWLSSPVLLHLGTPSRAPHGIRCHVCFVSSRL